MNQDYHENSSNGIGSYKHSNESTGRLILKVIPVALHKEIGRNIRKSLLLNRVIVLLILIAAVFAGCDMFFRVSSSAFASDPPDPEVYPCNAGIKAIESVVPESHRWIALKSAPVAVVPIREGLKTGDLVGGPLPEMNFAYAPPGEFMMGIPACEPQQDNVQHKVKVRLTRGFYIQTTEVTQGQWKAVMGNNPSKFSHCGDNCPVEQVSWDNVQEFIGKLNMKGGREYRLPTEAEWEYAAHAGTTGTYSGNLDAVGWYKHNAKNKTHPVAKKKPNAWGIYDMHGNVFEWCQDGDGGYPPENSAIDPAGSPGSHALVIRGGSFASSPRDCRSVDRLRLEPFYSYLLLGFRLVFSQVSSRDAMQLYDIKSRKKHFKVVINFAGVFANTAWMKFYIGLTTCS